MPITFDPPSGGGTFPPGYEPSGPVLNDGEFELDGFRFGGENDSVVVQPGGFDPGTAEWRVQDQDNPSGDGVVFGRDLLTGPTWGFTFLTNEHSVRDALASLEAMAGVWLDNANRSVPGAVSVLRYNIGGRMRRVYGRPRRWSMSVTPDLWGGVVPVIADFKCVDTLHYDDDLRTLQLPHPSASPRIIERVGGSAPAPFVAVIYGPAVNPWITGPGWNFEFLTTLTDSQSLTVDTRPWAKTVLRQDGVSLAGALTRTSTALSDARLPPGYAELTFDMPVSMSSATSCSVSWRPTYRSL